MTRDEKWLLDEKYAGDISAPGFSRDCKRLGAGEPLAYVIGWQPFLSLNIYLDSHPLIPRPETEWWVEHMLAQTSQSVRDQPLRILDLCAGSGAIGCSALARLPNAHVSFGEIAQTHEATIRKNIRENNLDETRADIRIGDLFAPFRGERFDLIATNPPYIPSKRILDPSVSKHEPHHALFSGGDGLTLTRRIAKKLGDYLTPNGDAWIEIDSAAAQKAAAIFSEHGFNSEIRTDQHNAPRVLVVSFRQ